MLKFDVISLKPEKKKIKSGARFIFGVQYILINYIAEKKRTVKPTQKHS